MKTVDEQIQKKREFQEFMEQKKRDLEEKQTPFTPNISTYSKNLDRGDEPIHERLFKMSTRSPTAEDPLTQELTFTPRLLSQPLKPREGKIEQRLYQEHVEREIKQQKQKEMMDTREKKLHDFKFNERSKPFLRSKLEKEVENAFISEMPTGIHGTLSYDEFSPILFRLGLFKSGKKSEDESYIHDKIWKMLDAEESGAVNFETYKNTMMVLLDLTLIDENPHIDNAEQLRELATEITQFRFNKLSYSYVHTDKKIAQQQFDKELTFHPRINQSFDESMDTSALNGMARYEWLLSKKQETEAKLKFEREKKSNKEMQECTFQPKINKKKNKKNSEGLVCFHFYLH
jgi:hypothetical protein